MLALPLLLAGAALAAEEPPVTADLLADLRTVTPGGHVTLAVRLRLAPHWHVYWKNPGDSGLPTRLTWTLPPGWSAGAPAWPTPKAISTPPFMTYGYEDEVVLPIDITVATDAPAGPAILAVRVDWLVCQEECKPGRAALEHKLLVGATAEPDPAGAEAVAAAKKKIPASAGAAGWKVVWQGTALRLTPPTGAPTIGKPRLLPDGDWLVHAQAQQAAFADGTWTLTLPLANGATLPATPSGVVIDESGATPALALP